jgi:aldose sugar dehydrogenase
MPLRQQRCCAAGKIVTMKLIPTLAVLAAALLPFVVQAATPKPVTVVRGLANPWGLAVLPDGRMLVTERAGRLRLFTADGKGGEAVAGLPAVSVMGQCGLLDVVADPAFAQNQRIWFTFAEPGPGGNSTAVARARLQGNQLTEVRTVFVQQPKVDSRLHCGSRIVFDRAGHLWVGLGDRFARMADAQEPANHLGKIVRIDAEGKAPADNPFIGKAGAAPELWSLGHRNIQGMAVHPATGELWASEHGPQGGDEINVAAPGKNYGWPLITYGRNYGMGTRIGEEGPKAGYEMPLRHWVPVSVAPSGLVFVTSDRYPAWKGSLLMGTLRAQALVRLSIDGRKVVGEERLYETLGQRIRDVRQGPDGHLFLLTEGADGQVIRLEP